MWPTNVYTRNSKPQNLDSWGNLKIDLKENVFAIQEGASDLFTYAQVYVLYLRQKVISVTLKEKMVNGNITCLM